MRSACFTCLIFCAIALLPSAIESQQLKAAEAKAHLGENATVCGVVASKRTASASRGRPTFIDLDDSYPNELFTVLVWGNDQAAVGKLPRLKSHICATGLIDSYRGASQITVRRAEQLTH